MKPAAIVTAAATVPLLALLIAGEVAEVRSAAETPVNVAATADPAPPLMLDEIVVTAKRTSALRTF